MTDELAMEFYLKSDLPEKSYYKSLAGVAVRGYRKTSFKILKDKVNKDNIDLVLEEFDDFINPYKDSFDDKYDVLNDIMKKLKDIKNS